MRKENEVNRVNTYTRGAENTYSRENPGEESGEKQEGTGTVGRIGKARKRQGNNRHCNKRKERHRNPNSRGGEGGNYSKEPQVLGSPHSPAITAADR